MVYLSFLYILIAFTLRQFNSMIRGNIQRMFLKALFSQLTKREVIDNDQNKSLI